MKKTITLLFSALLYTCLFAQGYTTTADSLETSTELTATEVAPTTPSEKSLFHEVEEWYVQNMNYASITVLMTIESSFLPFPSEIVIPPAAYVASKEESELNIFLVVLFGTLGALFGALINYFLAMYLGRPLVYKFADSKMGHAFLLSKEKVVKAEEYFVKNGNISTLVGRLVPGIRQLISIPAGLSKMNLLSFMLYTTIGALIWNSVLALLGYLAHGQQDLINKYNHELSLVALAAGALFIAFLIIKQLKKKKNATK